jgi:hypothetical protein
MHSSDSKYQIRNKKWEPAWDILFNVLCYVTYIHMDCLKHGATHILGWLLSAAREQKPKAFFIYSQQDIAEEEPWKGRVRPVLYGYPQHWAMRYNLLHMSVLQPPKHTNTHATHHTYAGATGQFRKLCKSVLSTVSSVLRVGARLVSVALLHKLWEHPGHVLALRKRDVFLTRFCFRGGRCVGDASCC